jgi:hypothetical protein
MFIVGTRYGMIQPGPLLERALQANRPDRVLFPTVPS